jgi:hypothetical protein
MVMRKRYLVALITAAVVVVVVTVFLVRSVEPPAETAALIEVAVESGGASAGWNVTRGEAFTVNVTVSSVADKELSVPLGLTLENLENVGWLSPVPASAVFNFTYSPDVLVLQPHGSGSSVLTVNLAGDAPVGAYVFYVELGNSQATGVDRTVFNVEVNA